MIELQTEWIALGTDKSKFHGARTKRKKEREKERHDAADTADCGGHDQRKNQWPNAPS
jgi:hypothetical protein